MNNSLFSIVSSMVVVSLWILFSSSNKFEGYIFDSIKIKLIKLKKNK